MDGGDGALASLNRKFWPGKRILLTGHTGFKGGWAAIWLTRLGATVTGLSLAPDNAPNLYDLARVEKLVDSVVADVGDPVALARALDGRAFDLVLHMAAQSLVRASIVDPIGTFMTNVMGTGYLLEALRDQSSLLAILVVTSDKVYANHDQGRAFVEGDCLGGRDPYSASKAAAELVVSSYAHSFYDRAGVHLASARAGNVVGGGDFSRDRLVADIVRAAMAGGEASIRHPEATRPWQHVLDCMRGYLAYLEALAGKGEVPPSLNFGPKPEGQAVTVGELATMTVQGLGAKPWRHHRDPASIEARSLAINASLARRTLGIESRLSTEQAIRLTVDWYAREAAGEDAFALCCEQIEEYEASL